MPDEHKLTIRTCPVLDTGIGQSLGYRDDKHLIEASEAERAEIDEMLTPEAAARIRRNENAAHLAFLFGQG
jgi:hypothetical protein